MKFTRFKNAFHPGEILLQEFLIPMNVSQRKFSGEMKWTPRKLNEIINGKRGISALSAIDLGERLGTTPEFWMNLQQIWELDQAYQQRDVG